MYGGSSSNYERSLDPTYGAKVQAKWINLTVEYNGTDKLATVINAWPMEDGSVGLFLRLEDDTTLIGSNEYWTVKVDRDG
jgi:hypothetical protein